MCVYGGFAFALLYRLCYYLGVGMVWYSANKDFRFFDFLFQKKSRSLPTYSCPNIPPLLQLVSMVLSAK